MNWHLEDSCPRLSDFLRKLGDLFFPRYCCVCGKCLGIGEECTCLHCLMSLPYTNFKGKKGNIIERILWDERITTEHASSFLFYRQSTAVCNVFFQFKYWNNPAVAVSYGRMMAQDLMDSDFFETVDMIVPVPLSVKRYRKRGYNQSERLSQGISEITGLPVCTDCVMRSVDNPTQTHLSDDERKDNVRGIFVLSDDEAVRGKHVLIVDDMVTTGSTIKELAYTLLAAGDVRISVLTLGTSRRNTRRVFPDVEND